MKALCINNENALNSILSVHYNTRIIDNIDVIIFPESTKDFVEYNIYEIFDFAIQNDKKLCFSPDFNAEDILSFSGLTDRPYEFFEDIFIFPDETTFDKFNNEFIDISKYCNFDEDFSFFGHIDTSLQDYFKNIENGFIIKDDILIDYIGNSKNPIVPEGVKEISFEVFYLKDIESVTIPDSVEKIKFNTYDSSEKDALEKMYKKESLIFSYNPHLKAINVSENNPHFSSIDGVLYNKDKTSLIKIPENINQIVIIEKSVQEFDDFSARHVKSPKIVIPENLSKKMEELGICFSCPVVLPPNFDIEKYIENNLKLSHCRKIITPDQNSYDKINSLIKQENLLKDVHNLVYDYLHRNSNDDYLPTELKHNFYEYISAEVCCDEIYKDYYNDCCDKPVDIKINKEDIRYFDENIVLSVVNNEVVLDGCIVGSLDEILNDVFYSNYFEPSMNAIRIVDEDIFFTIPSKEEVIEILNKSSRENKSFANNFPFGAEVLNDNVVDVYDQQSNYEAPFSNLDDR